MSPPRWYVDAPPRLVPPFPPTSTSPRARSSPESFQSRAPTTSADFSVARSSTPDENAENLNPSGGRARRPSAHRRRRIVVLESLFVPKDEATPRVADSSSPDPLFLLPAADVDSDSDARSTPSDCYDENAENIDPNGEMEGSARRSTRPRPTNILCDSEFYPISDPDLAEEEMVADELIPSDDDPSSPAIVAPIPLPYTARSKDVLASMISHGQTASSPTTRASSSSSSSFQESEPTGSIPIFSSTSYLPVGPPSPRYFVAKFFALVQSDTAQSDSSSASMCIESPHIAIRPVSPPTLVMLTEPVLMKWTEELG
ncbi:hypothetical protein FB45DRAFT_894731 [Roridomyces roridus]|uniref:Uncharacterized protein n=1 Tax=Roridomyces roridus TaxID=1738132 RepID=A0AAD7CGD8_9AGAR|nr:hypothetical protein FB45DRAFT_894731 [Roridomyces roridus]